MISKRNAPFPKHRKMKCVYILTKTYFHLGLKEKSCRPSKFGDQGPKSGPEKYCEGPQKFTSRAQMALAIFLILTPAELTFRWESENQFSRLILTSRQPTDNLSVLIKWFLNTDSWKSNLTQPAIQKHFCMYYVTVHQFITQKKTKKKSSPN